MPCDIGRDECEIWLIRPSAGRPNSAILRSEPPDSIDRPQPHRLATFGVVDVDFLDVVRSQESSRARSKSRPAGMGIYGVGTVVGVGSGVGIALDDTIAGCGVSTAPATPGDTDRND